MISAQPVMNTNLGGNIVLVTVSELNIATFGHRVTASLSLLFVSSTMLEGLGFSNLVKMRPE